ncbi:MAG: hypothetical protein ACUZ8I_02960 [Candidatus Scalindua sp.]
MVLTRKYLKEYQKRMRIYITDTLANELLDKLGHHVVDDEGHVYEYTEQDIYEQVRKPIQRDLEGGNRSSNF